MKKLKVGIIGATGYVGAELVRILLNHPYTEIAAVSGITDIGKPLGAIFQSYLGLIEHKITSEDEVIAKSELVFTAIPHGFSEKIAVKVIAAKKILIDLGADFRLNSEQDFIDWYGDKYHFPELHKIAAYIIPELNRNDIAGKRIVANPGCYPTSISLGLAPALKHGFTTDETIICDSKSGVTGAGIGLSLTTHFTEANEAFGAYKIAAHRHTPEIEQNLSRLAGRKITVVFVPHLLPCNRGIESTIYAAWNGSAAIEEIYEAYAEFYKNEKFVRVLPLGATANIKTVKGSNYCDISLHLDIRGKKLIICSVIDNMVKGAAGQAVQNMNLIAGFKEDAGLNIVPAVF